MAILGVFLASVLVPIQLAIAGQSGLAPDDYHRAEGLIRDHRWDEGLAALQPLLRDDPKNLKAINLAALAFTGKGDILRADEYFKRALRIDPEFLPALKNLAVNEFNSKDPEEAERHLSLALKLSPDDPVINLYLGELSYEQKNFARAAGTLSKAGPLLRRDPNVAAHLGISYLSIGERQKAIELLNSLQSAGLSSESQFIVGVKLAEAKLFEAAIPYLQAVYEIHPDSYDTGFDLAVCYLSLNQYQQAIEVLRAIVNRGQETAELDNVLAEAYRASMNTQQAIDALRRAIALAPDDEDNYLDFASLCIDHQDFAAALKVLNVGLQVHPNSDRLLFERAILHAMQDNFQLAEQDFQQVALLSPEKESTYKGLGVLYLEAGNAAQAVQIVSKRLRESPDDPDLLYLLGEALLRSGAHMGDASYSQAQSAFEKSIKLNPRLCLPRVSLGKMYLEQDRIDDAVVLLERARAIDPREKSTYWQLAIAYRKLGQTGKQKEVLNSLKSLNDEERAGSREKTRIAKETESGASPVSTH